MAKHVVTTVVDDISGEPDAETVSFSFQGTKYTIDLASKNLEKLTKALQPYIDKSTRVRETTGSPSRGSSGSSNRGYDIAQLRAWAVKNKIAVPARGRIPAAVVEQYRAGGGR